MSTNDQTSDAKIVINKNFKQKKPHIGNKDAYERVNFLYQAAHLMMAEDSRNIEFSRFYTSTAKTVTKKLVLKISPQVKRTLCKCCHVLLVPGKTGKFRIRGKREKHMVVTCLTCGTIKRQKCQKQVKKTSSQADDPTPTESIELSKHEQGHMRTSECTNQQDIAST